MANNESPNYRQPHAFDPVHNGVDECECGLVRDAEIHPPSSPLPASSITVKRTPQLSEAEVEEIAQKKAYQYGTMVSLTVAQRDALIRDWRTLRAEIADYERTDLVPRTRYNAADAEAREAREMVKTVADRARVEFERLESENAALREQLAQAQVRVTKLSRELVSLKGKCR